MSKFDKSKVLVAGLHEVKAGEMYIVADFMSELVQKVNGDLPYSKRCLRTFGDCFIGENGNTFRFAYPYEEPVKKWRPFETLEEAESLLGKKIKRKDLTTVFSGTQASVYPCISSI